MTSFSWQPGMTLASVEQAVILQAIRFYRGNKTMAANALGVEANILDAKVKKYEFDQKEQERITNGERRQRDEFLQRQRGSYGATPIPAGGENVVESPSTPSVESPSETSKEYAVPMPKRTEVQGVLPGPSPQARHRRHR